jgi:hypothetical protein
VMLCSLFVPHASSIYIQIVVVEKRRAVNSGKRWAWNV